MGLNRGPELAFDDQLGLAKAARDIAAIAGGESVRGRPPDIARPGHAAAARLRHEFESRRGIRLACLVHIDDEGQNLVLDRDERERLFRGLPRRGRDRRNRLAAVARDLDFAFAGLVYDVDRPNAGVLRRGSDIDRNHSGMGMGRTQDSRDQHARQFHVDRKARGARDLGAAIGARHALADDIERRVASQGRRLVARDPTFDLAQCRADDAGEVDLASR